LLVKERRNVYEPMTLARLGTLLSGADDSVRWRLVAEFLEEYRWEPVESRAGLLEDEPAGTVTSTGMCFWLPWPSMWPLATAATALLGQVPGRCGGSGSRSMVARRGLTRSSTRRRLSGAVAYSLRGKSWKWHDRRRCVA
jgi:hypothetical protein